IGLRKSTNSPSNLIANDCLRKPGEIDCAMSSPVVPFSNCFEFPSGNVIVINDTTPKVYFIAFHFFAKQKHSSLQKGRVLITWFHPHFQLQNELTSLVLDIVSKSATIYKMSP